MLNLRVPGRLPTMRSRDLTLGGVKKKTFTPNIIGRKSKEDRCIRGHTGHAQQRPLPHHQH